MGRYARKAGRRKYPGRRTSAIVPQPLNFEGGEVASRLVAIGSRIDGIVKSAISPELLKKTEGLPWHARCARIAAITGRPFTEINEDLHDSKIN